MRRGFSLLELVAALGIMSVAVSLLLPAARSAQDRLSVVAAREDLVALIVRARGEAIRHGGSSVVVRGRPAEAWIAAGGVVIEHVDIRGRYRAELELSGAAQTVELHFDATGLGRMAARSITVHRGGAVVRLVISAYGRLRRE